MVRQPLKSPSEDLPRKQRQFRAPVGLLETPAFPGVRVCFTGHAVPRGARIWTDPNGGASEIVPGDPDFDTWTKLLANLTDRTFTSVSRAGHPRPWNSRRIADWPALPGRRRTND